MSAIIDFTQELWTSILTPGTTPALIKATHASFAALLLTLGFLLFATWNYHFIFLTIIASGLWAAITWFIKEIEIEKAKQQQKDNDEKKVEKDNSEIASSNVTSSELASSTPSTKSRRA